MNAENCKINLKNYESFGYHVVEITKIICVAVIVSAILFSIFSYLYPQEQNSFKNVLVLFYGFTALLALIGILKLKPWCLIPFVFSLVC